MFHDVAETIAGSLLCHGAGIAQCLFNLFYLVTWRLHSLFTLKAPISTCIQILQTDLYMRGALGYIRNRKTEEKNHPNPQKNLAKTENRIQNRQKPIQWWQVGHTEQTKLTLISPKYLWMSWTLSEAFVSFCVCLNHRLCFGGSLEKPLVMEPS